MPSRRKKDLGLFLSQDRPKALDLAIASARAHNRMMADFCQVDRRLLATGYVPVFIRLSPRGGQAQSAKAF
jgi:hypothetical protein